MARLPGAGVGEGLAYHPVTRAVAVALRRRLGWPKLAAGDPARRVVVAVSGGADSVALLRVMHTLSARRGWATELTVGHVQHHLRGDAGEADARWVEALCAELGVRFEREDVRVAQGNVEAAARAARYTALRAMARRVGADEVMTAHTLTDQWETVLMRVSRGTGLAGLAGIAWRRGLSEELPAAALRSAAAWGGDATRGVEVVRPMLGVRREEARALLAAIGQGWREDETNEDAEHRTRARLRRDVLPVLAELYPGAEAAAGRLADAASAWGGPDVSADVWAERDDGWIAERSALAANATGAVRLGLWRTGVPMGGVNADTLASIAAALQDGVGGERAFALADGWRVVVTRETVAITRLGGGAAAGPGG